MGTLDGLRSIRPASPLPCDSAPAPAAIPTPSLTRVDGLPHTAQQPEALAGVLGHKRVSLGVERTDRSGRGVEDGDLWEERRVSSEWWCQGTECRMGLCGGGKRCPREQIRGGGSGQGTALCSPSPPPILVP